MVVVALGEPGTQVVCCWVAVGSVSCCAYALVAVSKPRSAPAPSGNISLCPESDRVVLNYRYREQGDEWLPQEYAVMLERTPCHYGGERVWFRCPRMGCGRRVAILYAAKYFVCRHCLRLAYESQREQPHDGAMARA